VSPVPRTQQAVEPQLLFRDGHRFACRVYLCIVSRPVEVSGSVNVTSYVCNDGWILRAPEATHTSADGAPPRGSSTRLC
jgi:hypothetical protein